MSEKKAVDFSDLVGERILTGVSEGEVRHKPYEWSGEEVANTITFVLDGVAYTAQEDPSDGYRSYLGELYVGGECANRFDAVRVSARTVTSRTTTTANGYSWTTVVDLLELVDVETGKVVLEVGTDNSDDYYPSFVASFMPEHMAINAARQEADHE